MILNLKTISPAKWYDAMSVPDKNNVFYHEFKNYFKESLKKQNINHVYLIGKGKWPLQYLFKEQNCVSFSQINDFLYLGNIKKCY